MTRSAFIHITALCSVAQSCPTLCDPLDFNPPGSSLSMGILQARILEWVAMPSYKGSSQPRDWTQVSCIAGGFITLWATGEALCTTESRFTHVTTNDPISFLFTGISLIKHVVLVSALWQSESVMHIHIPRPHPCPAHLTSWRVLMKIWYLTPFL